MIQWIKDSKAGLALMSVALAMLVITAVMGGCSVDEHIRVRVPPVVADATGTGVTQSLADARRTNEFWREHVRSTVERLKAADGQLRSEIERGAEVERWVGSLIDTGIGFGAEAAGTFPGGAVLVGLLAGAGGLLTKRPGEEERVRKEKEASFNKGLKEAAALVGGDS